MYTHFFNDHAWRATTKVAPTNRKNRPRKRPISTKKGPNPIFFAQIEKKLPYLFGF
jgi:hypothetical protein